MAATVKKRSSSKAKPGKTVSAPARRGGRRKAVAPKPQFISTTTGWAIIFTVLCIVFLFMVAARYL